MIKNSHVIIPRMKKIKLVNQKVKNLYGQTPARLDIINLMGVFLL